MIAPTTSEGVNGLEIQHASGRAFRASTTPLSVCTPSDSLLMQVPSVSRLLLMEVPSFARSPSAPGTT